MRDDSTVQSVLQKQLRRLVAATVVLYTVLAGFGGYVYTSNESQQEALAKSQKAVTTSLCAFRSDLEQRSEQSKTFLRENPKGIPGISTKLIKDGIKAQEQTIEALDNLNCEGGE